MIFFYLNFTVLPCKKVLAVTPWKKQRDDILFTILEQFNTQKKPVMIFANSIVEVNLLASSLRSRFSSLDESALKAIGTNISATLLKKELVNYSQYRFMILSAQMALAAFFHGIVKINDFVLLFFADMK